MLSHLRMRDLSFRPRPLDVNKRIPVITEEIEDDGFASGISRGVPELPTGMEHEEETEKHLQELLNQSLFRSAAAESSEIPTPVVKIVEGYDDAPNPNPFTKPISYIMVHDLLPDELDQLVEYDMDDDDDIFLGRINSNKKILTEDRFEFIMDRFEKEMSKNNDEFPPISHMEQVLKLKPNLLQAMYSYWHRKRSNSKNPLVIRLLKPPDPEDPSPYKAFRTRNDEVKTMKRKNRKNDQPSYLKLKHMRQEMERSRTLLEMISKREKLKRERLQVVSELIDISIRQTNDGNEMGIDESIFESSLFATIVGIREQLPDELEVPLPLLPKLELPATQIKTEVVTSPKKKRRKITSNSSTTGTIKNVNNNSNNNNNNRRKTTPKRPTEIYDFMFSDSEDEISLEDNDKQYGQLNNLIAQLPQIDDDEQVIAKSTGMIKLGKIPPFRGRARMGRGGRIIFDRRTAPKPNGVVSYFETDEEYNSRIHTMVDLYKSPYHPLACSQSDPDVLLKKLEKMIEKKKKKLDSQSSFVSSSAD